MKKNKRRRKRTKDRSVRSVRRSWQRRFFFFFFLAFFFYPRGKMQPAQASCLNVVPLLGRAGICSPVVTAIGVVLLLSLAPIFCHPTPVNVILCPVSSSPFPPPAHAHSVGSKQTGPTKAVMLWARCVVRETPAPARQTTATPLWDGGMPTPQHIGLWLVVARCGWEAMGLPQWAFVFCICFALHS